MNPLPERDTPQARGYNHVFRAYADAWDIRWHSPENVLQYSSLAPCWGAGTREMP